MQIRLKLLLLPVSLILFSTSAFASMQDLEKLLEKFQSYQAKFSQQSYDQKGEPLQHLDGVMQLQKPDHFYWESNEPNAQKLVSDGVTIWHFDADLEQVVIQEFAKQAKQAPILIVLRDSQSLKSTFKLVDEKVEKNITIFSLAALDKNAALKKVDIGFVDGVLKQLVFVDSLQQKTQIDFSQAKINPLIKPSLFEFVLPDGADVLYE